MQTIPLSAVASQSLTVTLNGQNCQLNIYAKTFATDNINAGDFLTTTAGAIVTDASLSPLQITAYSVATNAVVNRVFVDVYINNTLIIGGVPGLNAVKIVRDAYLGFSGDLVFYDLEGSSDPLYSGLGTRWVLVYYLPSEL